MINAASGTPQYSGNFIPGLNRASIPLLQTYFGDVKPSLNTLEPDFGCWNQREPLKNLSQFEARPHEATKLEILSRIN